VTSEILMQEEQETRRVEPRETSGNYYGGSMSMSNPILYEHPLNERIRVFLRLEHFFLQSQYFLNGEAASDTQSCVAALIEILTVLERNDVRSEVLKELDRHISGLSKLSNTPAVDHLRLGGILEKLTIQIKSLQRSPSRLTVEMRDNELLQSIRQRTAIAAGTCGFDLPAYHYLLNQPAQVRREFLARWLAELNSIKEGIDLLLALLRSSALFDRQVAEGGFYQRIPDASNPCQLLRICMPPHALAYPEVSGSKHRISIRFLAFSETGRPKQITEKQEFDISCCVI
jgi:cell division protein ZapD